MTMALEPTRTRSGVTKAVIPSVAQPTRLVPAARDHAGGVGLAVDDPAIQCVVREAVAAGCDDVLLQGRPLGLGHAVLQAAPHIGDEAFVLLIGDDLIDPRDSLLCTMLDVRLRYGGCVVALAEVPRDALPESGRAVVRCPLEADVVDLADLVAEPAEQDGPTGLALIGRFVLDPHVFAVLRATPPGRDGQIQLTDALRTLAAMPADHGGGVRGVIHRGRRDDADDGLGRLTSAVALACQRPDLGPAFRSWLRGFVAQMQE